MNKTGRLGEEEAARYLEEKGMKILKRNFRSPYGEVDIIVRDNQFYAFVEVKSWKSYSLPDLEYSINPRKKARIMDTARYFMYQKGLEDVDIRFDVILLNKSKIWYYKNAFSESD